jgi:hypothetical protein
MEQQADLAMIRQLLGIVGVRTVLELRGVACPLSYAQSRERAVMSLAALGGLWRLWRS